MNLLNYTKIRYCRINENFVNEAVASEMIVHFFSISHNYDNLSFGNVFSFILEMRLYIGLYTLDE